MNKQTLFNMISNNLSLFQAGILTELYEKPTYRSELASALQKDDPSTYRAALVLVEKGLIEKRYVPKKEGKGIKRSLFVMTDLGRELFQ